MKYLSSYRGGRGWTGSAWPTSPGPADTTESSCPPTMALPLSGIDPDAGSQAPARRTVGNIYRQNGSPATPKG